MSAPEYNPLHGYWSGPVLAVGERPWPLLWESRSNDTCPHTWERVIWRFQDSRGNEPVVRCRDCHVPRCGDSTDPNPCMERRHHRTVHIRLLGDFGPVGGYLS